MAWDQAKVDQWYQQNLANGVKKETLDTIVQQKLAENIVSDANAGKTLTDIQRQYSPYASQEDIVKLYTGANYYGEPNEPYAQKILGTYQAPTETERLLQMQQQQQQQTQTPTGQMLQPNQPNIIQRLLRLFGR